MHFNAVCDRFSPYDTIFEIAEAKMLTDTKLSAACSLHTASGSTSSTSSSRKKRLVEIAEEDEDDLPPTKRKSVIQDAEPPKSPSSPSWNTDPVTLNADLASSPENSKFSTVSASEVPAFVGADDRPSTSDSIGGDPTLDYSYLGYPSSKPKIKLGPRPSVDSITRPQAAGNFRPVSAIPSGYKLFGKGKRNKSKDSSLPSSPQEEIASLDFASPSIASSDALTPLDDESMRPTSSSGQTAKKTISPEKARLMKAMKLREKKKKQQAAAAEQTNAGEEVEESESPQTEIPEDEAATENATAEKESDATEVTETAEPVEDKDITIATTDSGVVMDGMSSSVHTDQTSDLTNSEPDQSTKASSISESTDETVRLKDEEGENNTDNDTEATASEPAKKVDEPVPAETVEKVENEVAATGEVQAVQAVEAEPIPETVEEKKETTGRRGSASPIGAGEKANRSSLPISRFSIGNLADLAGSSETEIPKSPASNKREIPEINLENPTAQDMLFAAHAASQSTVVTPAVELAESPLIIAGEAVKEPQASKGENSDDETVSGSPAKQKRRGIVEPINTKGHSRDVSKAETTFSQDDQLIEEMQSATLEEAKPVVVPKSPLTPITPIDTQAGEAGQGGYTVRTISNPVRGKLIPPGDVTQSSARSVSTGAAYLHKITQQAGGNNLSVNKAGVGSSISQRIKALEMLSATNATDSRPVSRERPQSTFFSVKKREPSRSPSVMERTNSLRQTATPSPSGSRETSPETARVQRGRSGSIGNRLSMFQPSPDSYSPPQQESISVTAKIVRDGSQPARQEVPKDPSAFNPLDLKESPLFVSHQKASPQAVATPVEPPQPERTDSHDSTKDDKSRRTSLSIVRGFMKDRQKSPTFVSSEEVTESPGGFSHRLSISSRSSFSKDREPLRSPKGLDSPSSIDEKSGTGDNKMSRAGRFMKRLSTLSGSRSKTSINTLTMSSVAQEESSASNVGADRPSTTGTSPWIVSYLGDVNVQFPDSLLWKRRNLCLDSQGFCVLSALPAQSSRAAQGTKRYHLSEFKPPYTPEVEMQELPNSVVLDFVEGTSLQLACEDRTGQLNVLNSECRQIMTLKKM